MVGFQGLKAALLKLYPDGIIDRTNTRIVSKSPPCLTDIAVYLTGGRSQFSTFYVDNEIDGIFTAQRIDNQKVVSVALNPGVKPVIIDSLGNLANQQKLSPCSIDELRILEDEFIARLLKSDPKNIFTVTTANDFNWDPNQSTMYPKTDIVNRDLPKCNL